MRILLFAVLLAGCSTKHVSRERAQAACDHQIELGYWTGFEGSVKDQGLDPKDPKVKASGVSNLAEQRATKEWAAARDKCADPFEKAATEEQLTCVIAATTQEAALDCIK